MQPESLQAPGSKKLVKALDLYKNQQRLVAIRGATIRAYSRLALLGIVAARELLLMLIHCTIVVAKLASPVVLGGASVTFRLSGDLQARAALTKQCGVPSFPTPLLRLGFGVVGGSPRVVFVGLYF